MSIVFNADEIFALAERIEINGEAFYKSAAKAVDPSASRLLYDLSVWEAKHRKLFADMRGKLPQQDRERTAFDPNHEASLYLQAMADSAVFKPEDDPLAELGDDPDMKAILHAALRREKDAIAFFTGMKELVPEFLGKDHIGDIIREEMRHVTLINRQLATLGA